MTATLIFIIMQVRQTNNRFIERREQILIGVNEAIKSLEEAICFNDKNLFEYIRYIQFHRNVNAHGDEADDIVQQIDNLLNENDIPFDISCPVNSMVISALNCTSDYAYESGFREAIRLIKVLMSM